MQLRHEEPRQHRTEPEEGELREVDDVHDAEDERDADRSEGVDVPPPEQAGDQSIEHGGGSVLDRDPGTVLQHGGGVSCGEAGRRVSLSKESLP